MNVAAASGGAVAASCFAFACVAFGGRLSKSKSFYYVGGVLVGVFAGIWFLSRNRAWMEQIGFMINLVGFTVASLTDLRFKIVYAVASAFCGFCAVHIQLQDFDPDSAFTDVVKWLIWVTGALVSYFGVFELNAAFGVVFLITWVSRVCVCRRTTTPTQENSEGSETDSQGTDTDLDEPPTAEEIAEQQKYYAEGRRNAIRHMRRILPRNEMEQFLTYVDASGSSTPPPPTRPHS